MNKEIAVIIWQGEARVDSRLVAGLLGIQHENFRSLIYKYEIEVSQFGDVPWIHERRTQSGGPQKYTLLNLAQLCVILSYVRSFAQAVALKRTLIKALAA